MNWKEGTIDDLTLTVLIDDQAGMNTPYLSQHSVSFCLEVTVKEEKRCILFDAGAKSDPVLGNMRMAGLDPASVDMIILSHSHYDHTGGLEGFVRAVGREDLPIIAHPGLFRTTFVTEPFFKHVGIPGPDALKRIESLGGRFVLTDEPVMVATGMMVSGSVPRQNTLEASAGLKLYQIDQDRVLTDEIQDDISLYIHTPKGLVVVTGCAHAGIINILDYAVALTGKKDIESVVGGFHLTGADDQRINWTIKELQQRVSGKIYSGHCTGLKAEGRLLETLGDRYRSFYSGKVIRFNME